MAVLFEFQKMWNLILETIKTVKYWIEDRTVHYAPYIEGPEQRQIYNWYIY